MTGKPMFPIQDSLVCYFVVLQRLMIVDRQLCLLLS
jgi:hypothetical protein